MLAALTIQQFTAPLPAEQVDKLHRQCILLAKFATFVLRHLPAVDKTSSMWVQGATRLIFIFYFAATIQSEAIREKLRALGVHLQKYLYTTITAPNSAYVKLLIPWLHQRCQAGQYVQVEPAIRVWAKPTLPYTSFSAIVISCFDACRDAWTQEHALIGLWQDRLNFPFIYKFFKRTAFGHQKTKFKNQSSTSHTFTILFAKVRRRFGTLEIHPQAAFRKTQALQLLYDLSQPDAASFQASKKI